MHVEMVDWMRVCMTRKHGGGEAGVAGVGGTLLDFVEDEADSCSLETRLWIRIKQGEKLLDYYVITRCYEVRPTDRSDDSILLVRPRKGAGHSCGIGQLQLTVPPPGEPASLLSNPDSYDEVLKQLCFLEEPARRGVGLRGAGCRTRQPCSDNVVPGGDGGLPHRPRGSGHAAAD